MKKKIVCILIVFILLICNGCQPIEASATIISRLNRTLASSNKLTVVETLSDSDIEKILISNNWEFHDGRTAVFNTNGTGYFTFGGTTTNMEWDVKNGQIYLDFTLQVTYTMTWGNNKPTESVVERPYETIFDLCEVNGFYRLVYASGYSLSTLFQGNSYDLLTQTYAKQGVNAKKVNIRENASLPFASLSINKTVLDSEVKVKDRTKYIPKEGNNVFYAIGKIENTGGKPIGSNKISTEFIIDGKAYPSIVYFLTDNVFSNTLDPLCDGEIYLISNVPLTFSESSCKSIKLRIWFMDDLSLACDFCQEADTVLELTIK